MGSSYSLPAYLIIRRLSHASMKSSGLESGSLKPGKHMAKEQASTPFSDPRGEAVSTPNPIFSDLLTLPQLFIFLHVFAKLYAQLALADITVSSRRQLIASDRMYFLSPFACEIRMPITVQPLTLMASTLTP